MLAGFIFAQIEIITIIALSLLALDPLFKKKLYFFNEPLPQVKGRGTKIGVMANIGGMSGIPAPRQGVLQDNTQQGGGGSLPQHLVYLERLKRCENFKKSPTFS